VSFRLAYFASVAALSLMSLSMARSASAQESKPVVSAAPPIRLVAAADAQTDLALMRRALETIHPGLYRRTSKVQMDRQLARLEQVPADGLTDAELYRRISLLLADVRCTHTKAEQTSAMEAWRKDQPSHLPFRFRLIDGRMLVVASDVAQSPLAHGAEVVAINGRSVRELVRTLGEYVPIDGYTEASRANYLADDGDLMGADFDHFYPYVYGFAERFDVVVKDGRQRRAVSLKPITFRAWVRLANEGDTYRSDFSDGTRWRMIDRETGYLLVPTFVNYRKPADPAALYARAIAALTSQGMTRLVLDLRNNGGGSNDAALGLIDALAPAPYRYQRAVRLRAIRYGDLPDYISTWGDRDAIFMPPTERFVRSEEWFDLRPEFAPDVLQLRNPAPTAFVGPVAVLISPANASGATMTIARLRDMNRVRLIGESSGGSADGATAGTVFMFKLPKSGITVRIPLAWNQMDVERFDPRGGIAPDVRVPVTVADFRAQRDRALEEAVRDLEREALRRSRR
jgi:hypothetical protein